MYKAARVGGGTSSDRLPPLGHLLAQEGTTPNHKKLLRIYLEEELGVLGRKRPLGTRKPMVLSDAPKQR